MLVKIILIFVLHGVSAENGVVVSGGGDPDAVTYVQILNELPKFFASHKLLREMVSPIEVLEYAKEVSDSLNDPVAENDLVQFSDTPILVGGIHKAASFDAFTRRVTVYRGVWQTYETYGQIKKMQGIVLLETLLALKVPWYRYSTLGTVLFKYEQEIPVLELEKIVVIMDTIDEIEGCALGQDMGCLKKKVNHLILKVKGTFPLSDLKNLAIELLGADLLRYCVNENIDIFCVTDKVEQIKAQMLRSEN